MREALRWAVGVRWPPPRPDWLDRWTVAVLLGEWLGFGLMAHGLMGAALRLEADSLTVLLVVLAPLLGALSTSLVIVFLVHLQRATRRRLEENERLYDELDRARDLLNRTRSLAQTVLDAGARGTAER